MKNTENKIKTKSELIALVAELKREGKSIVTTNGVFDMLHVGHVTQLEQSSKYGDVLIVLVNSDESVKRYKGNSKPIIPLEERMRMLAALEVVSFVSSFNEDTPVNFLKELLPNTHTKGGDYHNKEIPEKKLLDSYGGSMVLIPLHGNISTSAIIKRIVGE